MLDARKGIFLGASECGKEIYSIRGSIRIVIEYIEPEGFTESEGGTERCLVP